MRAGAVAMATVLLIDGGLRAPICSRRAPNRTWKSAPSWRWITPTAMLQAARDAYQKDDNAGVSADVAELQESVDLAFSSLNDTHKDPRRSPRWFKYAEIQTRDLLRKLDTFQQDMSFQDRPLLDKVKEDVQQVHDKLLLGLMEGKPK